MQKLILVFILSDIVEFVEGISWIVNKFPLIIANSMIHLLSWMRRKIDINAAKVKEEG